MLVWFYALALIVLAGAVVNELRFERDRDQSAGGQGEGAEVIGGRSA